MADTSQRKLAEPACDCVHEKNECGHAIHAKRCSLYQWRLANILKPREDEIQAIKDGIADDLEFYDEYRRSRDAE